MAKNLFNGTQKLLNELAFPFYAIKRDLHITATKRRLENDAEHSWTLAFIACAMAQHIDPSLDKGKVAQMAIVHDLVEVYAGDTSVWRTRKVASKESRESDALRKIGLNFKEFPWIHQTIAEYETKQSKESKYIWALDKYIALLTRLIDVRNDSGYFLQRKISQAKFERGIEAPRRKAQSHDAISQNYEKLIEKFINNPQWFYG